MNLAQQFNALNGKTNVSRKTLELLLAKAEREKHTIISKRIIKVLKQNDDDTFDIELKNLVEPYGLNAPRHAGAYKQALDSCGRLKKGFKFENGSVVKVEPKKTNNKNAQIPKKPVNKIVKTIDKSKKTAQPVTTKVKVENLISILKSKYKNGMSLKNIYVEVKKNSDLIIFYEFVKSMKNDKKFMEEFNKTPFVEYIKLSKKPNNQRIAKPTVAKVETTLKTATTTLTENQLIETLKPFTSNELRPVLKGIYFNNGFAVATDAHVLIELKYNYPKEYENKILNITLEKDYLKNKYIHQSFKEYSEENKYIDGKYPLYQDVIPNYKNSEVIDVDKLSKQVSEISEKMKLQKSIVTGLKSHKYIEKEENNIVTIYDSITGKEVHKNFIVYDFFVLEINNHFYNVSLLEKITKTLQQLKISNVKISTGTPEKPKALIFHFNNGKMLLMPVHIGKASCYKETINQNVSNAINNVAKGLNACALFSGLKATAQKKEPDTIAFNKKLMNAIKKGIKATDGFVLGFPKGELKKYVDTFQISLSGKVLQKAIAGTKNHNLNFGNFIDLPDFINNPIAIFKSKTKGFVVLTEIKDIDNKPVIVALHVDTNRKDLKIASMYVRENDNTYKNWIKDNLHLYINTKSNLFSFAQATIAVGENNLLLSNKNNKNNINNQNKSKNSLKAPISELEKMGFVPANKVPEKAENVYKLGGEIGKFLQEQQPHKSLILIKGNKHSSKSQLAMQIANAYAETGEQVAYIDYEQGGITSKDTVDSINRNTSEQGRKNIAIIGYLEQPFNELQKFCKICKVIVADSVTDLKITADQLNELRNKFIGVTWVFISQVKENGAMYGGNKMAHNPTVIINCSSATNPKDRIATLEKNRGNDLNLKYSMYSQKVIKPEPKKKISFKVTN